MTAELTKALCAFHRDVSTIHKEASAQYGRYADLAGVLSTVLPALSKNGLAVVQSFQPGADPGEQFLVTSLLHTSGERVDSHLPLTVPKGRNPLHDWGGATTYSRRYALLAILSLAAGVEDDDGAYATDSGVAAVSANEDKPAAKTPSKKQVAGKAFPGTERLSAAEIEEVVQAVSGIEPQERLLAVVAAFRERFGLPQDKKAADYIKTAAHRDFLLTQINGTNA